MAGCPRKEIFDPEVVGVYHCWNRCVRRSWLCGVDPLTGNDYRHQRVWIEQRQALLAQLFAIEIGWHAELSNHLHLILRNRPDVVQTWSDEEVVRRVLIINKLPRNFGEPIEPPSDAAIKLAAADAEQVAAYRRRLSDISAFMASLDEYKDRMTGAFFEGRFHCRNLEDETAILVCGIYIDLNQIRAGEAAAPEESTHTSTYNRICGARLRGELGPADAAARGDAGFAAESGESPNPAAAMPPDGWLCKLTLREGREADVREGLFSSTPWRLTDKGILPLTVLDYLSLLDWSGRELQASKSGSIPEHLAPILERLHIQPERWMESIKHFETLFGRHIGRAENLARRLARSGRGWIREAGIAATHSLSAELAVLFSPSSCRAIVRNRLTLRDDRLRAALYAPRRPFNRAL